MLEGETGFFFFEVQGEAMVQIESSFKEIILW